MRDSGTATAAAHPSTTYVSLLRCALGDGANFTAISTTARAESQLWKAISTTAGPLRLSWPQIQLWARADRNTAKHAASDTGQRQEGT